MTSVAVPFTYAEFVTAFPEFANPATYPAGQINFWIPHAYAQLNAVRYGTQLGLAAMLFVAHNITLSARNAASAATGQIVGQQQGVTTGKSVGEVSISYDASAALNKDAGFWNTTTYGSRLFQMMQSYGVGPNYVPGPAPFGYRYGGFGLYGRGRGLR